MTAAGIALSALAVMAVVMLGELRLSRANERWLIARGAIEPPDPVYATMRWAYPTVFAAMAIEGVLAGREPGAATIAGAATLTGAKALKF